MRPALPKSLTLLLLAALLAGCADRSDSAGDPTVGLDGDGPRTALLGRVASLDLLGIAQANVSIDQLGLRVATDPEGLYAFYDVAPGDWVLKASKAGYRDRQERASVRDGSSTVVNFTLEEAPAVAPFHETLPFKGQVSCQAAYGTDPATASAQDCGSLDPNNQPSHVFVFGADAAEVQFEVFWNPGTPLAKSLRVTVEGRGDAEGQVLQDFQGGPGMKGVLTPSLLQKYYREGGSVLLTVGAGLSLSEDAPYPLPADAGVAFQQSFEVDFTVFYHAPGPEDFTARPE